MNELSSTILFQISLGNFAGPVKAGEHFAVTEIRIDAELSYLAANGYIARADSYAPWVATSAGSEYLEDV